MKHIWRFALVTLFFSHSITAYASDPDFTAIPDMVTLGSVKTTLITPAMGSHQVIGGIILETLDTSPFLSATALKSEGRLRVSNVSGQDADFTLGLKIQNPGGTTQKDPYLIPVHAPNNSTLIISFPVQITPAFWNILKTRTQNFNAGTLEFDVTFMSNLNPSPNILAQDGHIPFYLQATTPSPQTGIYRNGDQSLIEINGKPQHGNYYYLGWNTRIDPNAVRQFAAAGKHNYRVVFQPWTLWKNGQIDATAFHNRMIEIMTSLVGRDPEAQVSIVWWLYGPKDWGVAHPNEVIIYDDGTNTTPNPQPLQNGWQHASYSSQVWKDEQTAIVSDEVHKLVNSPFADRIFSISLGYGNAGEWNNFGYLGGKFPDYSMIESTAFIDWCKAYGTIDNLNKAWKTHYTSWNDITIPTRAQRMTAGWSSFGGPDLSMQLLDYHRFQSVRTANLISYFAHVVKTASNNKLLVGTYYGYLTTHMAWAPGHSLDSGHYALSTLLQSPDIDYINAPYDYADRQQNIGMGTAINSIMMAGKAFDLEDDLPSHRMFAVNPFNAQPALPNHGTFIKTAQDSILYYWRDMARISAWGINAHWYDFSKDWYNFPEFSDFTPKAQVMQDFLAAQNAHDIAEVAVLIDEDSAFYLGNKSYPYGWAIYQTISFEMDKSGAPWDIYLASDIDKVLQKKYKLIIVLNQINNASALRQKLLAANVPVVWGYGAGMLEKGQWSQQPNGAGVEMKVLLNQTVGDIVLGGNATNPFIITAPTSMNAWAGIPRPNITGIKPRMEIKDTTVTPLAVFKDDSSTAVGMRGNEFWVMTPLLSRPILSSIYEKLHIHRYSMDGSSIYANSNLVTLWNPQGGDSVITLPRPAATLVNATTGQTVARNASTYTVKGTPGEPTLGIYLITWPSSP